mgnify:FL=1
MKIISCVLFMLTCLSQIGVIAQNTITLSGKITDQHGTPLSLVTIAVENTTSGTYTDDNGRYSLKVSPGKCTLVVSLIGYQTVKSTSNIQQNKTLNFTLEESAVTLNSVEVYGKTQTQKVKEGVFSVNALDIKPIVNSLNNLNDLVNRTTGIKVREEGGVGSDFDLSINGLSGNSIRYFLDGMPLDTKGSGVSLANLPVNIIDRIEIYKGVVPAKFGGSAVGGAVNIVIKEYPPRYLDASYSFGSFNTHKASSVFKRNLVKQGIELGAALLYTHSDNDYRMELPQNKGKFIKRDHDKFNQSGGGISMKARKWWFDQMEFELEFIRNSKQIQGVVENIRSAESSAGAYNFAIDLQKDNFLLNGLDFSSGTGYAYSQYNFVDTARLRYDWDMNPYPPVSAYGGEIGVLPSDMKMRKHTVGNKTNLNYIINDRHSINLNSLFKWALGKPSDPLLDKAVGRQINFDSHMTSWVLGLGYDYKSPNDKFLNSLTGKYYYYSMNTKIGDVWNSVPKEVDMQQHDWGVSEALRYRFTKELLGKASVSYDVRLPTDAELIGDGFLIAPSGDLKPERGTNANIGLMYDKKIGSGLLQVEVNGFFSYLQDMIRYTRNFVQGRYTNFGEMRTFGVEAEVKADVTRWLYGYVNATFQDLRDTRKYEPTSNVLNPSKGLRMPNIPYFLANAGVEFHKENLFGGKGQNVRLFTDASFVEEYFFDFEVSQYQEKRIPRSFKLDLGLEYSIMNGGLTFSAKASNLTNARLFSEFNYPLPGRAFTARIRYVLK